MGFTRTSLLLLAAVATTSLADPKSYEGYRVFQVEVASQSKASQLLSLQRNLTLDFWKEPRVGGVADVMVAPSQVPEFQASLQSIGLTHTLAVDNVESTLVHYRKLVARAAESARSGIGGPVDWSDYNTLEEIYDWADGLAADNDFVTVTTLPTPTYEGRNVRVLSTDKAGPGAPTVYIEAGIHAREWISPAVGTYIIDQVVNMRDNDFVDSINFHFTLVANPDGYAFTYDQNGDRLWRKNRADSSSLCLGIDLNRNFGYHWGDTNEGGPCGQTYPGDQAFSEVESQVMRDYVLAIDPAPTFGMTLHSYAEEWLVPFGYSVAAFAPNYQEQTDLANEANDALNGLNGENYIVIHSAALYPASGDSNDWLAGEVAIRFQYTLELTGGEGLVGSFELDPEEILPTAQEVWASMNQVTLPKVIELN